VAQQERWQLSGNEPEFYELYQVPRLLGPMALRLLEGVALRPGQRVLDVACGTGIVARLAAPRVAPSGRVVGVDLNAGMLAMARARAAEAGLEIEWRQADAAALPFEDAAFDVVLCQQGLQFFPDKPAGLREMHRVTAREGTVVLAVLGRPSRFNTALAEGLTKHVDAQVAKRSLAPYALADAEALRAVVNAVPFSQFEIRDVALTRRVEPTQEWLLQYSAAMPYADAVAGMEAGARAEMVREIAGRLRDLWEVDSFAVPIEVRFVYARK
jgi:ubiquinone/menaquinone biosynthesis C-methylase UbiE